MVFFHSQLLTEAKMSFLEPALQEHPCDKVLTCASRLQSTDPAMDVAAPVSIAVYTADQSGKEFQKCVV